MDSLGVLRWLVDERSSRGAHELLRVNVFQRLGRANVTTGAFASYLCFCLGPATVHFLFTRWLWGGPRLLGQLGGYFVACCSTPAPWQRRLVKE